MTETVDLYMIARLEDHAAVVDIYCCVVFYDPTTGASTGRSVGGWWESLANNPDRPVSLASLDEVITECGYTRVNGWRTRVTASGQTRFFADATAHFEDLDRYPR